MTQPMTQPMKTDLWRGTSHDRDGPRHGQTVRDVPGIALHRSGGSGRRGCVVDSTLQGSTQKLADSRRGLGPAADANAPAWARASPYQSVGVMADLIAAQEVILS